MTGGKPLPETLRTWAASVVGPVTGVRDAAWPRVASRVWELTCGDGDRFFLKVRADAEVLHPRDPGLPVGRLQS